MSLPEGLDLKALVLSAAKDLFLARGYDAVGMRDIAAAVGRQPVQIYRLNLSKSDILAELILELNEWQIRQIPHLLEGVQGEGLLGRVRGYLLKLYQLDIQNMPIRAVGAAVGWTWGADYEQKIVVQVKQLLQPIVTMIQEAGLGGVQERVYGIWALYYVGYRRAALQGGSAEDCIAEIGPTLAILLGCHG